MNIKVANILMNYNPTIKDKHRKEERRMQVWRRYLANKRVEIHDKEIEKLPGVRFELEASSAIVEAR